MKRSSVVVLGLALLGAACDREGEDGRILASGHVEATEVLLSTKVGGTLERLDVDEGDHRRGRPGDRPDRHRGHPPRPGVGEGRARAGRGRAEPAPGRRPARRTSSRRRPRSATGRGRPRRGDRGTSSGWRGSSPRGPAPTKARDDAGTRRDVAAASVEAPGAAPAAARPGFRPEEIDAARARVQAADARIAQLEQQIEDAVIVSPVAGVVTEKLVGAGRAAGAGAGLVGRDRPRQRLAHRLRRRARPRPDPPRPGGRGDHRRRPDAGRGRSPSSPPRRSSPPRTSRPATSASSWSSGCKVALDNADGLFKPGMPAEARLQPGGPGAVSEDLRGRCVRAPGADPPVRRGRGGGPALASRCAAARCSASSGPTAPARPPRLRMVLGILAADGGSVETCGLDPSRQRRRAVRAGRLSLAALLPLRRSLGGREHRLLRRDPRRARLEAAARRAPRHASRIDALPRTGWPSASPAA